MKRVTKVMRGRAGLRSKRDSLGMGLKTQAVIREIKRGFPFRTLGTFANVSGLAVSRVADVIGIPERTLARRRVSGRLAPEESERLLRVSRIFDKAVELFEGDRAAAMGWLNTPRPVLDEQSPLEYSRTEPGAREVENLIGQLEHGVFA